MALLMSNNERNDKIMREESDGHSIVRPTVPDCRTAFLFRRPHRTLVPAAHFPTLRSSPSGSRLSARLSRILSCGGRSVSHRALVLSSAPFHYLRRPQLTPPGFLGRSFSGLRIPFAQASPRCIPRLRLRTEWRATSLASDGPWFRTHSSNLRTVPKSYRGNRMRMQCDASIV
jgi:hypothetical protein